MALIDEDVCLLFIVSTRASGKLKKIVPLSSPHAPY